MTIHGHMLRMAAASLRGEPEIGDPFQGGFYYGDIVINGDEYYLIISDKSAETSLPWKTSNTNTNDTSSFVDGLANSIAMDNANHPAAKHCRDYRGGGFDDWYLWAVDESHQAWLNIPPPGTSTPPIFQTGQAQALTVPSDHWASTQVNVTSARVQRFFDGGQNIEIKTNSRVVRPIRRVRK